MSVSVNRRNVIVFWRIREITHNTLPTSFLCRTFTFSASQNLEVCLNIPVAFIFTGPKSNSRSLGQWFVAVGCLTFCPFVFMFKLLLVENFEQEFEFIILKLGLEFLRLRSVINLSCAFSTTHVAIEMELRGHSYTLLWHGFLLPS